MTRKKSPNLANLENKKPLSKWQEFKIHKKSKPIKLDKKTTTFGRLLTIFSILGTGLASVGFGVSMAVTDVFSLPHETLFSNTLDLIQLSVWGITQFINGIIGFKSLWPAYIDVITNAGTPAWLLFLCSAIYVLFRKQLTPLIIWLREYAAKIKEKTIIPKNEDSPKVLILKFAGLASIFTIGVSILFFTFFFVSILSVGALIFTTTAGLQAGHVHIQKFVIKPKSCRPLRTREQRFQRHNENTPTYADCVAVSSDRRNLGRGRLVFATATSVLLFDPKTGTAWRVPTKDAVVETVDTLEDAPSLVLPERTTASTGIKE